MKKKQAMPHNLRRFVMSCLFVIGGALIWNMVQKNKRGEMAAALSQACDLQMACQSYARSHEGSFPPALPSLVSGKVVDQKEYDRLTSGVTWRYFGGNHKLAEADFVLAASEHPVWNAATESESYLKIHSQVGVTMEDTPEPAAGAGKK